MITSQLNSLFSNFVLVMTHSLCGLVRSCEGEQTILIGRRELSHSLMSFKSGRETVFTGQKF